ncbi:hypothetical protein PUN28_004587 [Cardiocondyla obscurior]|uniref:Mitochondrial transcription rescue factor 1 C-terminal domain-containing protein n=1 Tax=Cardiocondyla obscurior TaxID=286306 RepID=A0AAW2GDE3_9HYME
MFFRVTINIVRRSVRNYACTLCRLQYPFQDFSLHSGDTKPHGVQNHDILYVAKRFKSKKKTVYTKREIDEDSDEENENDEEEEASPGSKVIKVKVPSLRLDAICKVGFGMSRNKIEEVFYASKLRLNGMKVLKKSKEVDVGDEIDIILHHKEDNPALIVVNRIVILSINVANNDVQIKLSRDKNLLIENYDNSHME